MKLGELYGIPLEPNLQRTPNPTNYKLCEVNPT